MHVKLNLMLLALFCEVCFLSGQGPYSGATNEEPSDEPDSTTSDPNQDSPEDDKPGHTSIIISTSSTCKLGQKGPVKIGCPPNGNTGIIDLTYVDYTPAEHKEWHNLYIRCMRNDGVSDEITPCSQFDGYPDSHSCCDQLYFVPSQDNSVTKCHTSTKCKFDGMRLPQCKIGSDIMMPILQQTKLIKLSCFQLNQPTNKVIQTNGQWSIKASNEDSLHRSIFSPDFPGNLADKNQSITCSFYLRNAKITPTIKYLQTTSSVRMYMVMIDGERRRHVLSAGQRQPVINRALKDVDENFNITFTKCQDDGEAKFWLSFTALPLPLVSTVSSTPTIGVKITCQHEYTKVCNTGLIKKSINETTPTLKSNEFSKTEIIHAVNEEDGNHNKSIGATVGGIIGALIVIAAIVVLGILIIKKRKTRKENKDTVSSPTVENNTYIEDMDDPINIYLKIPDDLVKKDPNSVEYTKLGNVSSVFQKDTIYDNAKINIVDQTPLENDYSRLNLGLKNSKEDLVVYGSQNNNSDTNNMYEELYKWDNNMKTTVEDKCSSAKNKDQDVDVLTRENSTYTEGDRNGDQEEPTSHSTCRCKHPVI